MKKVLALVLATIMVLSISAAFADKTPLTLWSIAVEGDSNRAAYLAAVDAFNAANPDFEMTMEPTENEAYKTKIKAAMNAGTDLPDTVLANTTYEGKHYGVPLTMNVVTLFANMDLLAKVGCEKVPETYDELIEVCKALKAADIIPFGVSGKENWCLSEYTEPLLVKTIGAKGLEDCYTGAASWDQPGVIEAMNKFIELKEYIDPNAAALGNEEVKQAFIDGKYAFYQNGSWNCGDISDKAQFTAAACMFPVVDAEKATLYEMVGGPNDTLAVTATCADPAVCAKAAFDLGCTISREGNLNGAGLPTWAVDYDTTNVKYLSNQVAEMVAQSQGMVLFGDNFLSADAANTYLDFIAQIFAGDIDAEGFAKGLAAELQAQ